MSCSNSSQSTVSTLSQFTNNHEVVTVPGNAYCSIVSNHPVLVVQLASGQEADNTFSHPLMMNVSPINHYSNECVVVTPAEFHSSVIAIFVTPEYHQPERIFVDGMNQSDAKWTSIPCYNETRHQCNLRSAQNLSRGTICKTECLCVWV